MSVFCVNSFCDILLCQIVSNILDSGILRCDYFMAGVAIADVSCISEHHDYVITHNAYSCQSFRTAFLSPYFLSEITANKLEPATC